jgi:hypothetical protein
MSRCERFEHEAVLALEEGRPLDEHFSSCPDCLEAMEAYERLRGQLSSLSETDEPPPDWQARVWERIEHRKRRRPLWPWWVAPMGVAALAALFLIWTPAQQPPGLRIAVEAGGTVRRGAEAHPGDLLRLAGSAGGARYSELRVYRNDLDLILRCSTEAPCSTRRGELRAAVVLDGIGRYQPLLLYSDQPLPRSASDLESDTSAALASGAEIELGPEVVVR